MHSCLLLDPWVHGGLLHMAAFVHMVLQQRPSRPLSASQMAAEVSPPQRSSLTSWSKFWPSLPLLISSVASCSFPFQHFPSFVISLYVHPCVYLLDVFLPHSPVSFWRTESCLFTTFSPASKPCRAQRSCSTLSWVNEGGKGMSE